MKTLQFAKMATGLWLGLGTAACSDSGPETAKLTAANSAAVAAAAVGMLASRVGVSDTTVTLAGRALAGVLVLGLTFDSIADQTLGFTRGLWSELADVGSGVEP